MTNGDSRHQKHITIWPVTDWPLALTVHSHIRAVKAGTELRLTCANMVDRPRLWHAALGAGDLWHWWREKPKGKSAVLQLCEASVMRLQLSSRQLVPADSPRLKGSHKSVSLLMVTCLTLYISSLVSEPYFTTAHQQYFASTSFYCLMLNQHLCFYRGFWTVLNVSLWTGCSCPWLGDTLTDWCLPSALSFPGTDSPCPVPVPHALTWPDNLLHVVHRRVLLCMMWACF